MTLEDFTTQVTNQLTDLGFDNIRVDYTDPHLLVLADNNSSYYGDDIGAVPINEATITLVVNDFKSMLDKGIDIWA